MHIDGTATTITTTTTVTSTTTIVTIVVVAAAVSRILFYWIIEICPSVVNSNKSTIKSYVNEKKKKREKKIIKRCEISHEKQVITNINKINTHDWRINLNWFVENKVFVVVVVVV